MAKKKTRLVYGNTDESSKFALYFEHEDLAELTRVDRSLYGEALDRIGTILLENLENRKQYDREEGDANAGIRKTLEFLRQATSIQDLASAA